MGDLANVASLEDVHRALKECEAKEERLRGEMEQLASECEHWSSDPSVRALLAHAAEVKKVEKELHAVERSIRHATQLGDGITKHIKGIDLVQQRVDASLSLVVDVVAMKNSVQFVNSALQKGDVEGAADFMGHFREKEGNEAVAAKPAVEDDAPLDAEGVELLNQAQKDVEQTARERLAGALSAEDPAGVVRFACVHARIGLVEEGYHALKSFFVTHIHQKAERALSQFHHRPKTKQDHSLLVEELFDVVSRLMEAHEKEVVERFGVQKWIGVVLSIKGQCDAQLSSILDRHQRDKQLLAKVKEIQSGDTKRLSAMDVDKVVQEYATILHNCGLFEHYMRGKYHGLAESAGLHADAMESEGSLHTALLDATDLFIALETFVMRHNVAQAIAMDKSNGADPDVVVSTVIDDVFYCLQRSSMRAIATGLSRVATLVMEQTRTLLLRDTLEVIKHHLGNAVASTQVTVVASGDLLNHGWVLVLNDAQVCGEYASKLGDKLRKAVGESFEDESEAQLAEVNGAVDNIATTGKHFKKMLDRCVDKLFQVNAEQLASVFQFQVVEELGYDLTEEQFAENEANDPFAVALCERLEGCLVTPKDDLVPAAFDALCRALIVQICTRLEREVLKKPFTQLGGLQLDKDIRTITNLFVELCHGGVRDLFARLRLVASLLTVDRLSEAAEIFGDGSGQPLKMKEVVGVLKLRSDFSASAVAALQFPNQ